MEPRRKGKIALSLSPQRRPSLLHQTALGKELFKELDSGQSTEHSSQPLRWLSGGLIGGFMDSVIAVCGALPFPESIFELKNIVQRTESKSKRRRLLRVVREIQKDQACS